MSHSACSSVILLKAYRKKGCSLNPVLFEQLYHRYQKELYLYLYGLCRNETLAEDLVQDTFLKAMISLPDGHPNFRAWLYMVARNLFFDQYRHESRLTVLDETHADGSAELCDRLISDETRACLYHMLGSLEARRREVLLLQYFSGLPQKEIAAILHLTPENVRILACRGRRDLKKQMEESGYEL